MFCNKCGNKLEDNQKFCNKCGNQIEVIPVSTPVSAPTVQPATPTNSSEKILKTFIGIGIGVFVIVVVSFFTKLNTKPTVVITKNNNEPDITVLSNRRKNGETAIEYDHQYEVSDVKSVAEAKNLIAKDSTDQKVNCPSSMITIENSIIKNYDIPAANYCEMDEEYSANIERYLNKYIKIFLLPEVL